MQIQTKYRLSKFSILSDFKKFSTKAPFYSVQQETKFINAVMKNVFKYSKEEYTQEAFDRIWKAIETNGLLFITLPEFSRNDIEVSYTKVLKYFFSSAFLAPFDGKANSAKLQLMLEYIILAIEQAGYNSEKVILENKAAIKKIALACMHILEDIQVLNSWQVFAKFLRAKGANASISSIDNDAFFSELVRNLRIYLWKDMPENAYTYTK